MAVSLSHVRRCLASIATSPQIWGFNSIWQFRTAAADQGFGGPRQMSDYPDVGLRWTDFADSERVTVRPCLTTTQEGHRDCQNLTVNPIGWSATLRSVDKERVVRGNPEVDRLTSLGTTRLSRPIERQDILREIRTRGCRSTSILDSVSTRLAEIGSECRITE